MAGQKNPAAGFLIMGAFSMIACIVFVTLYFLSAGTENAVYYLVAAGVNLIASFGMFVLYGYFKRKLQGR